MKPLLLAALAATTLATATIDLRPIYQEGLVRATSFHVDQVQRLTKSTEHVDGELLPDEAARTEVTTMRVNGRLTDTIRKLKGERVTEFSRKYAGLERAITVESTHGTSPPSAFDDTAVSALEGLELRFSKSGSGWKAHYSKGSRGDRKLLRGLDGLLAVDQLLPVGSADVGRKWKLDPDLLWQLIGIDKRLAFMLDGQDSEAREQYLAGVAKATDHTGKLTATLTDVEGSLATITLAIELEEQRDLTALTRALYRKQKQARKSTPGYEHWAEPTLSVDSKSYKGTGTLAWDIELGRPRSLELELGLTATKQLGYIVELDGDETHTETKSEYEGELRASFTTGSTEPPPETEGSGDR